MLNDAEMMVVWVHAGVTLAMSGLIWFVQVVHYPLFASVGESAFAAYERDHQRLTTWVAAPLMLVELVTAVWLAAALHGTTTAWAGYVGIGLVAVIWASTATLQVPCHRRLAAGFDAEVVRRLVSSNWFRTIAWTARGVLALWLAAMVTSG